VLCVETSQTFLSNLLRITLIRNKKYHQVSINDHYIIKQQKTNSLIVYLFVLSKKLRRGDCSKKTNNCVIKKKLS
jgi:hypothetical protein